MSAFDRTANELLSHSRFFASDDHGSTIPKRFLSDSIRKAYEEVVCITSPQRDSISRNLEAWVDAVGLSDARAKGVARGDLERMVRSRVSVTILPGVSALEVHLRSFHGSDMVMVNTKETCAIVLKGPEPKKVEQLTANSPISTPLQRYEHPFQFELTINEANRVKPCYVEMEVEKI